MEHFGNLLDRLMGARRLTSGHLAASAGCSPSLIRQARSRDRCHWRTVNRISVLRALHKADHLTSEDMQAAVRSGLATDMDELRSILRLQAEGAPEAESPQAARRTKTAFSQFLQTCTPNERQAFLLTGRLIAQLGPEMAARVLEGVQSSVTTVQHPDVLSDEHARQLVFVNETTFEDLRVRTYTPITPQKIKPANPGDRKHA